MSCPAWPGHPKLMLILGRALSFLLPKLPKTLSTLPETHTDCTAEQVVIFLFFSVPKPTFFFGTLCTSWHHMSTALSTRQGQPLIRETRPIFKFSSSIFYLVPLKALSSSGQPHQDNPFPILTPLWSSQYTLSSSLHLDTFYLLMLTTKRSIILDSKSWRSPIPIILPPHLGSLTWWDNNSYQNTQKTA